MSEFDLSLEEALAVHKVFSRLGYPDRAKINLMHIASMRIYAGATETYNRFHSVVCHKCWGDGSDQFSVAKIDCPACLGTGFKPEEAPSP